MAKICLLLVSFLGGVLVPFYIQKIRQYLACMTHTHTQIVPVLRRLYKSWRDLDLYIMGLLEKPQVRKGKRLSVTGPTHSCTDRQMCFF